MDDNIYKIALAAFFHDIGKFAERASASIVEKSAELKPAFYIDEKFLNDNMDLYQPHYNGKYTHKHAVYTAAFIDQLEKILPRKFNKGEWGLGDSFMNLAAGHHNPKTPLQWVIAMADRVSSGFEREEFEDYNKGIGLKDYKRTRLLTIFEGITIDGESKGESLDSYQYRYPLKELSPLNIFPADREEYRLPDSEEASKEYRSLFFSFIDSLEKLRHKNNIPLWFDHFDSLFMISTSHIPAATVGKVIPDISLYDHSKTTAALASAIYLYCLQNNSMEIEKIKDYEDKKFLIATGDFYGIQNFIFTEGGSTNKHAAKLLRGRSFAVSLISELAADLLCREIGLTSASIILNAAGKFTIIAPNTERTKLKIREVEDKINDWLVKMFYGETAIGVSFIEASCNDFAAKRFRDLWEALAKESDKKKYRRVNLDKYGGVIEDYLDQFNNDLSKKLCPFCGKRPSSQAVENDPLLGRDGSSACKICRDHIYMGTYLVKTPKIAVTTVDAEIYGDKLSEPIFGEYQVAMDVDGSLSRLADEGKLLKYWDISIPEDGKIAKDITAKFINGYVPKYAEEDNHDERLLAGKKREETRLELVEALKPGKEIPKTFLHIAKKSLNSTDEPGKFRGIEALGVLKADVDNLGLIFACGLKRQSLSRLATLSRQMNYFFLIYIPYLLNSENRFSDIYTVFAGGDDLFLIGPWNKISEFALYLNQQFRKYVCDNREITISAGISINKPGEPVFTLSERAEDALRRSKIKKDSATMFEESVEWEEFSHLKIVKETIETWLDNSVVNNAMVFRLNTFTDMARREKDLLEQNEGIEAEDWEVLKWRAMFKYSVARNVGKIFKGDEKDRAINEVNSKGADWLTTYRGALKIPIWQIIYNRR